MINATGVNLNPSLTVSNACFIKPIRGKTDTTPVLVYNTTSGEITYQNSSIKYKKNVIDLQEDTTKIFNIRAREYDTKNENKHCIGYIAEELNDIDTYFTWKNPDGTPEGIEWFNLLIYSIEEVKKLRKELDETKSSLAETKSSLNETIDLVRQLRIELDELKGL